MSLIVLKLQVHPINVNLSLPPPLLKNILLKKTWTGLWTVDYGLWTVDYGLWTVDYGLWTMDYGLWTVSWVNRGDIDINSF